MQRPRLSSVMRSFVWVLFFFQLSINGDKEFLDNVHKVNPCHLSPMIAVTVKQSEANQEAGPLPVKVDLNKTCV